MRQTRFPPFVKHLALSAVAKGFVPPEDPIHRYMELVGLKQLIDRLAIDCVLDVGANAGQFASDLRRVGYRKWLISFEPVPTTFDTLKNAFLSDPLWEGHAVALGSKQGSLQMNVAVDATYMSSLRQPLNPKYQVRVQEVPVLRLDEVLQHSKYDLNPDSRILLKIDTQGYDLEVFRGSTGIMRNVVALLSELSVRPIYEDMPHYLDALAIYESAGFELVNMALVSRSEDGPIEEFNCLMQRKSR